MLDNFLQLAAAMILATRDSMSEARILAYEKHMLAYLEGIKDLYPNISIVPNHHLALHLPEFLRSMGPWRNFEAGPYEMYNGMLQDAPHNSRFGEFLK